MAKISTFIIVLCMLASCSSSEYRTIEILGKEGKSNQITVTGMGVMFDDTSVITSAHVVRSDQLNYNIEGTEYTIRKRDITGDRALLSRDKNAEILGSLDGFPESIDTGSVVTIQVIRSGSIITLTGKVVFPTASVLGYDSIGRITTLSGILITDIDLSPGDSGAGIFDTQGRLLDVVHIK